MTNRDKYSLTAFFAACLFLFCLSALADNGVLFDTANGVTSVVSNVRMSKGWKRTYVIGESGGRLKDASNTIADYQHGAAIEAASAHLGEIVDSAHEGLTNSLNVLYSVTNRINEFTDRVYIAGDLQADEDRQNWWCYIANEAFDGINDTFYIWFSEKPKSPPRMMFRYSLSTGTTEVDGNWELPWETSVYDCGQYSGCHKCIVRRPAAVGRITMKVNAYPRVGSDTKGIDFARKMFGFDDGGVTNMPWTGVWTNSQNTVLYFNNGVFVGTGDENE